MDSKSHPSQYLPTTASNCLHYSLQTTEVFLYVFDAALMFITALTLAFFYPSGVITGGDKNRMYPDGSQELRSLVSVDIHSMRHWDGPTPECERRDIRQ